MPRALVAKPSDRLLIQGARILDPELKLDQILDVLIEGGRIKRVATDITASLDYERVFAKGLIVTPGWFDMHVHFREPGREDEETVLTGCAAAVAGGFTGVCTMPNTSPTVDKREIVEAIIRQGQKTMVEVYPIAAATKGREGKELAEMAELSEAGAVAFSDDGCAIATAELVRRALEYAGMFNRPIIEHAEDPTMCQGGVMNEGMIATRLGLPGLPTAAEDLIVARDILLAEYTGRHVHVAHISSKGAIELVRHAKRRALHVTCEVTPHHFSLTHEAVVGYDTNTKMNPPLRTAEDVAAVIAGLQDDTIDVIATDHAPHAAEEKELEYSTAPFGIVGLETALGLILTNLVHTRKLSLTQAVAKVTTTPRKVLNLPAVHVQEGMPANLTLFSLDKKWQVDRNRFYSKSRNTPFHGRELTGQVFGVYNKGQWWQNPDF
ncbi:MAG: dihydroorotase [bacterium]